MLLGFAVVPWLGILIASVVEQRDYSTEAAFERATVLARFVAVRKREMILGAGHELRALSYLPEARSPQSPVCSAAFSSLVTEKPRYANMGILDPNGRLLCNGAGVTPAIKPDSLFAVGVRKALLKDHVVMGDVVRGLTGRLVVPFFYAVRDSSGKAESVLFASVDVEWMNAALASLPLPPGTEVTLVDERGVVFGHYPMNKVILGHPLPDRHPLSKLRHEASSSVELIEDEAGNSRLLSLHRIDTERNLGSLLAVSIPRDVVFADRDHTLVRDVLIILSFLVVGFGLLLVMDRMFIRRFERVIGTLRDLRDGDLDARTGIVAGVDEVSQMCLAVDELGAALKNRKAEEERIRSVLHSALDSIVRAETRSRMLLSNPLVGVFALSANFRFQYVNARLAEIVGYSEEELRNFPNALELVVPEEQECVRELFSQPIPAEGVTDVQSLLVRRKDGSVIHIQSYNSISMVDGETLMMGMVLDVTEQVQAQKENEKLSRAIQNTDDIVLMLNDAGEIEYVNPAFERITGFSANEALGKTTGFLNAGTEVPAIRDEIWEAARLSQSVRKDLKNRRKDGSVYYETRTISAIRNEQGEVQNFVLIGKDVTESRFKDRQLQSLHDLTLVGLLEIDVASGSLKSNPAMLQMLGLESDAVNLSLAELYEFTHPDDLPYCRSAIDDLLAGTRDHVEMEKRYIRSDGNTVWCSVHMSSIRDELGKPQTVYAFVSNVSEAKAAEDLLLESEMRFRQIADNVDAALWMTDLQKQRLLYVSNQVERIWGHSAKALSDDPRLWIECIHPEDRQRVIDAFPLQVEGEYDVEYRVVRPDGMIRWVRDRAFPVRNEEGLPYRIAGIAEDVTEFRTLLMEREINDQRFRLMTEGSEQVFFYSHARNHVWEHVSESVQNVLGYSPDEMEGREVRDLILDNIAKRAEGVYSAEQVYALTETALRTGERSPIYATAVRHKNGHAVVLELCETPILEHGVVVGIQGFARDVTARFEQLRSYLDLYHSITEAVCIFDEEGRILDVNRAAEEMYKLSAEEMRGSTLALISLDEDIDGALGANSLLTQIRHVAETGVDLREINWWCRTYDGICFTASVSLSQSTYDGRRAVIAVARDISERLTHEAMLRNQTLELEWKTAELVEKEDFLRTALNSLPKFIGILDGEGTLEFINRSWETAVAGPNPDPVFGGSNMLRGANFLNVCVELSSRYDYDCTAFHSGIMNILSGDSGLFEHELVIDVPGKGRQWFSARATRFAGVGPARVVLSIENVSNARQAVSDKVVAEARFRDLFLNAPDGVFVTDSFGRFTEVNPQLLSTLNLSEEELLGHNYIKFVAPADADLAAEAFETAIEGEMVDRDLRFQRKGDTPRDLRIRCVPMVRDGEVVGIQGTARDVTELKIMEENAIAEEKRVLKDNLMNQVVHDLSNRFQPALISAHELALALRAIGSDKLDSQIQIAEDLIAQLKHTSDAIVSMRKTSIKEKQSLERVSLNDVVRRALKDRKFAHRQLSIKVAERLAPDLPTITADPNMIASVVENLVINAGQALDDPRFKQRKITVETAQTDTGVRLRVTDNGPGIPAEIYKEIFQLGFTTKHKPDTFGETGKGLGLATVQDYVKAHDGKIKVITAPADGTTFVVELPYGDPSIQTPVVVGDYLSTPPVRQLKVLVIEDNDQIRVALNKFLERRGHAVDSVVDGHEALDQLQRSLQDGTCYDVILSDYRMPSITGEELYDRIALKYKGLEERIIVLTGDATSHAVQNFLSRTRAPYIFKPFHEPAVVVKTVEEWAEKTANQPDTAMSV